MALVGCLVILGVSCAKIWDLKEEPGNLHVVVSDITTSITYQPVFASDFVRIIHLGNMEEPYVGAVKYEMFRMGDFEDEFWREHIRLDCDDLGEQEYWIRALYADPHYQAVPVRATLTMVDAFGECGEPMFIEGSREEE
jgi:hypothetical protein